MICIEPRICIAGLIASFAWSDSAAAQPSRSMTMVVLEAARFSIGSEDVEGPSLFGHIQGVASDGDGRIYVLDVSDYSIRIIDGRGKVIAKVGRAGRGPGDFANPWGSMHDGGRSLFVADQVTGIAHFATSSAGARFSRVLGRSLLPRTVCLVGDSLIAGGVSDGRLLHVLDSEGNPFRSFGASFSSDTIPALRAMADREPVMAACDSPRRRLIVAQHRGPLVRAYELDGRQLWQLALADYDATVYVRDGRNGLPTIFSGRDYTQSVLLLTPDLTLVQVAKMNRIPGDRHRGTRARLVLDHVDSYLIDSIRGTRLHRGRDLPSLLAARNGVVIEARVDPFPRLTARPFTIRR